MAPPGIFRRGRGVGAPQVYGATQGLIPVRSESELRAALARVAAAGQAGEVFGAGFLGAEIVIAAPFSYGPPFEIMPKCRGVTIHSPGRVALTPRAPVAHMFLVNAIGVTLRNIFCNALDETTFATTFVEIGDEDFAGDRLTIERCLVAADRIFVDNGKHADKVRVLFNEQEEITNAHAAPIVVAGEDCHIEGNELADGGGDVITIAAGARDTRIVANACNGGDIHSNASAGGNTIVGNTGTAAGANITAHASDAVGLNT